MEDTGDPGLLQAHSGLRRSELNSLGCHRPLASIVVARRPSSPAVGRRGVVVRLIDRLPASDQIAEGLRDELGVAGPVLESGCRSTKKPPARANHWGKVKWCRHTHGVMPAARAAPSTSR